MEKEFFALKETGGIADIEELNGILDRAVNLKNFLKGEKLFAELGVDKAADPLAAAGASGRCGGPLGAQTIGRNV